jgi:hypothetical protein
MTPRLPRDGEVNPQDIAERERLVVFRVVRSTDRLSEAFIDSFKSRAELGLPPRPGTPEAAHPLIHEGISVYESYEAAAETARRVRRIGRDIGGYVAELHIEAGTGVRFLRWGPRGHLTIWADSLMLSQSAVDTLPLD